MNQPNHHPLQKLVHWLWQSLKTYFMLVGMLFTLLPLLIVFLFYKLDSTIEISSGNITNHNPIQQNSFLKVNLNGQLSSHILPEQESFIFKHLFEDISFYYPVEFRRKLNLAKRDPMVKGLFINIENLEGSLTDFFELRNCLEDFKQSGKPIHIHLQNSENQKNYLLASSATRISVSPGAQFMLTGPAIQLMYFGDALRKLGVDIEVLRSGKYKSAFEPFIANQPSDASKEMYSSIEENLRKTMLEQISKGRNKSKQDVDQWFKTSIYSAKSAMDLGIIDEINFADDIEERLQTEWEAKEHVKLSRYVPSDITLDEKEMDLDGAGIGVIEAVGEIVQEDPSRDGDVITPRRMKKQIEWAIKEENVKSVVLRINSPGGSALAADEIWHDLQKLAEKKPLIVSMGSVAASGGYYIAAPAKKIFAESSTLTGSIGVISMIPNLSPFREKYGISFYVFSNSDRKQLLNPGEKSTAFDKALLEASIDEVYQLFLKRVSTGRNLSVDEVHQRAQGRVYTGSQAKDLALVDVLGGFQDAIQFAKEAGGLDPMKKYPIYQYEGDPLSWRECFKNTKNFMNCLDKESMDESTQVIEKISYWTKQKEKVLALAFLNHFP